MRKALHRPAARIVAAAAAIVAATVAHAGDNRDPGLGQRIELGPRPYFLVDGMTTVR